ncbi:MAG: LON peptidase substrate-binding domain-containing protein [Bacteriovoracaceae bacterium]
MVTNYEGNSFEFKETLPLLPVRDIVVYPFMILPLFVGRESSIKAVEQSLSQFDRLIFLSSQKDIHAEIPSPNEIFEIGTVAMIMRMRKLPDGRIKILIQGLSKARITQFLHTDPFYKVKLAEVHNIALESSPLAVEALIRNVKDQLEKVISVGKVLSSDILMVLEDITDPGRLADLIASNLNLKVDEAQIILETVDPLERLQKISDILTRELDILSMQAKIKNVSRDEVNKNQKENFLREQIKALKSELGEDGQEKQDDFQELRENSNSKNAH